MEKENYWFFWGGEFSQWCPSKFTIDETEYNCAERAWTKETWLCTNWLGEVIMEVRTQLTEEGIL
jgi:predicted NAD-dependent protein-ADP-ribosyltransferase YbiA (DUF1768 family)